MTPTDLAEKKKRATRPPAQNVLRTATFGLTTRAEDDGADDGDGLTMDGYAAVFERETLIDSWEGRFWEKLSNGSMKKSFRENPPIIQFDHGYHRLIGSIPIAELKTAEEASHPELAPDGGAHVVGRLMDNWLVLPVRDAIANGSVNGMSFRFGVIREKWTYPDGKPVKDEDLDRLLFESWWNDVPEDELLHRDLKELRVPELGPVVWPAYEETSVSVRSKVIDLGRLHEPEQLRLLATAVFLADTATRNDGTPEGTAELAAADHARKNQDPPEGTADPAAADHEPADDAPRSTEPDDGPAGEHESHTDPVPTDDVDAAREAERNRVFEDFSSEFDAWRDTLT
jgi:phage head maturation protease